jgi:hypothetical protein
MHPKLNFIAPPWVFRIAASFSIAFGGSADATALSANSAEASPDAVGFEEPPILQAPDLLPEYLISGDVFVVQTEVRNDGETNHYVVRSPTGHVDARGRDELERTIQELRALDLLSETPKRTGAVVGFNQGIKDVATAPYRKVKRVVFNPLYAIEAVPGEIVDYAGRVATVSDLFKYGPRVFIRRTLGIDGAREGLARRLGVDADTDHEALRQEIKRVGWGVWMGGLTPKVGEGYVDLEYDLSTEVGDLGDGNLGRAVAALRREVFPRTARRTLQKMDVPKATIQTFREHPHFSGRMRENVADALGVMKETEDRAAFVDWANAIDSEVEARKAVRLAQVMAIHHVNQDHIDLIMSDGGVIVFDSAGGTVVPLVYDYLIWSPAAADHLARAEALKVEHAPYSTMAVWSLGQVSPRLREVLDEREMAVRTEVGRDYGKFERPRKGLKKLEQRYDRRVEDPIKAKVGNRLASDKPKRLTLEPLGAPETR